MAKKLSRRELRKMMLEVAANASVATWYSDIEGVRPLGGSGEAKKMIPQAAPQPDGTAAEQKLAAMMRDRGLVLVVTLDEFRTYVQSGGPDPRVFVSMGADDQRVVFKGKDGNDYYVYEDFVAAGIEDDNSMKFR